MVTATSLLQTQVNTHHTWKIPDFCWCFHDFYETEDLFLLFGMYLFYEMINQWLKIVLVLIKMWLFWINSSANMIFLTLIFDDCKSKIQIYD